MSDICKIQMGQSPSSTNYTENPNDTILVQGNIDLVNGKVVPRLYTSEITKKSYPNEIIMTVRAPVGDIALNEYECCIGRGVCSIKGNKFIYYLLEQMKNNNVFKRYSQGSTFESINSTDIKNLKCIYPSIEEQNKIANFLSFIDKKIELLEKKHKNMKKIKKYYLNELLTDDKINKVKTRTLGNLCNIQTGKLDANAMVKNGKYRFFTCAKEYSQIDKYAFDTEALLIAGNGEVGHIQYYNGKFNAYQRTYVLDNFNQNIKYIQYYLEKNLPKQIWRDKQQGSMPYIVLSTLRDMKITYPSLDEQNKIVKVILNCDNKLKLNEEYLNNLISFKKGLLQKMFV